MVEIIPFIVIMLGWLPDSPGEFSVERPEIVFESQEACEVAGAKMAARMTQMAETQSGAQYEHRCFAVPSKEEFEAMLKQMEESRK